MEPDTVNCCPVLIAVAETDTEPDRTVRETVSGTSVRAAPNFFTFTATRHTL